MSCFALFCWLFICKRLGSITSVGEERASLSAWYGLRYFIMALSEPSIQLFCIVTKVPELLVHPSF